jgi:hypothetical protein
MSNDLRREATSDEVDAALQALAELSQLIAKKANFSTTPSRNPG